MKTKFAGTNPFTGEVHIHAPVQKQKHSTFCDVSTLEITNDVLPIGRTKNTGNKYDELFFSLKVGQCIKCQPAEVSKIAHALNTWLERYGKTNAVRSCKHYDTDKLGRIWLLEPVKRVLKVAA